MPSKRPIYRMNREHSSFLGKLNAHIPHKSQFFHHFRAHLDTVFDVPEFTVTQFQDVVQSYVDDAFVKDGKSIDDIVRSHAERYE